MFPDRSRRTVLKQLGLAGAGLALTSVPGWSLQAGEEIVPFTDVPPEFSTRRGETVARLDLRQLRTFITPNADYFTVVHYGIPKVDAAAWRLQTTGLVANGRTVTLEELKKRPRVERTVTFECGGNQARGSFHGMVGTATWAGASLRDLLRESRPQDGAREVIFWGADQGEEALRNAKYPMRFGRSMSLDEALEETDAIVAYEMNGEPLPAAHGFPVRLIVPGWYGVTNVKWLTKIELSDTRFANRFMGRDYVTIMGRQVGDTVEYTESLVARQRVKSAVARVTRSGGRVNVFGAAWSDGTPLRSVEVKVDDGAWQAARLDGQKNPFAWTFFNFDAGQLAPGAHTVVSRAADQKGRTQPAVLDMKKTYWEDNAQFTRPFTLS